MAWHFQKVAGFRQIGLDESVPNLETRNHVVLPAFVWAKFRDFWVEIPKEQPQKVAEIRVKS